MAYRKLVIRIWGVIFNHVVLKYRPLKKQKFMSLGHRASLAKRVNLCISWPILLHKVSMIFGIVIFSHCRVGHAWLHTLIHLIL